MTLSHQIHEPHQHRHAANCGHASVQDRDHTDYLHDAHRHRDHDAHWDECAGRLHAEHASHDHVHGSSCGHASVAHDGHQDYVHDEHRHAAHERHWDEH
ncbi:MAG: hypothetical protein FJ207_15260 [Gemmatimonadetes bacterium]|nr:hypothetical protein [Gemmatimonadota bacterium]